MPSSYVTWNCAHSSGGSVAEREALSSALRPEMKKQGGG